MEYAANLFSGHVARYDRVVTSIVVATTVCWQQCSAHDCQRTDAIANLSCSVELRYDYVCVFCRSEMWPTTHGCRSSRQQQTMPPFTFTTAGCVRFPIPCVCMCMLRFDASVRCVYILPVGILSRTLQSHTQTLPRPHPPHRSFLLARPF